MRSFFRFQKTFFECFFLWHVPPRGFPQEAGAIVSQASSATFYGVGKTNDALARVVRNLHAETGLPLFLQGEVAMSRVLSKTKVAAKTQTQAEAHRYLHSHDVALFHKEECDKRGVETVVVVAFPLHLWRAVKVAEKVGLRVVVPEIRGIPFDRHSDQWFCRNPVYFVFREIFARLFFLYKGYI